MERAETHDAPRGQKKGDVEVAQTIAQGRISMPMVEHIVDVPGPQVIDEVDVPMPLEVVEVAQISPESIMEHNVFEASVQQEHSFLVPLMKEEIVAVVQCTPQEHMRAPCNRRAFDQRGNRRYWADRDGDEVLQPSPQERVQ